MELLDAINLILRSSQRDSVSAVDSEDPSTNTALDTLQRVKRRILAKGHDFNTRRVTLAVNDDGRVEVPEYLDIVLPKRLIEQVDSADGKRYIWNQTTDDWHDEAVERVNVVFDISDFANIPHRHQEWIAAEAAFQFFKDVHGQQASADHLREERDRARANALNQAPSSSILSTTGWLATRQRKFRNSTFGGVSPKYY